MKKVLVLGAAGMAGHVVYTFLRENLDDRKFTIIGTTNNTRFSDLHDKLNVFDTAVVSKFLKDTEPDFVINCIGMLIRSAKDSPADTIFANSYFPHFLAKLSTELPFKLIHISTDCVFSGKTGQYTETSNKDALDTYGLSKSLGEILDDHNLTIRTSIIGPEIKRNGEGLFDWFMKTENKVVNGYRSNFWSGVTTLELAKFIYWYLHNYNLTGLFHLTNNEKISKYELLNLVNQVFKAGKVIEDKVDYVCNKTFVNTNSYVDYVVPSYERMLQEQKEFMNKHSQFYGAYDLERNDK